MNICILTSTALPLVGGLEIVVSNLATALSMLGHKVLHITPYPKKKITIADDYNYEVIRFGFRGDGRLKLIPTMAFLTLEYVVKRYKIDVINVHNVFIPGSWAYNYRKYNHSIPLIGTPHGDDVQITMNIQDGVRLDPKADSIVRRNLKAFDRITAISNSIHNDLIDLNVSESKIVDIPNGVWIGQFNNKFDSKKLRKRYRISEDALVIISVGRNHPRKGFIYGLEAINKLITSGIKVVYVLVGRDMTPLREFAHKLGFADCLITPGQVDSFVVNQLFQIADIYLSPSIVESFGLTTLEAMSAGLPCVVTNIPGSKDIVSSAFAHLVKPKQSDQLYNALKSLIENDEKRKKMAKEARKEALKYDWLNIAERYVNAYKEISVSSI